MPFPNFPNKHKEHSLFSPKDFLDYLTCTDRIPEFGSPKAAIICYHSNFLEYVLRNNRTRKVETTLGEMYVLSDFEEQIIVISNFGVGAPSVAILVEELIAIGVKRFISIGLGGSLQKLQIGDLVVCRRAIRDEGTSYHYLAPSRYAYAPQRMLRKIVKSLTRFKQQFVIGTTWTIDAPFRETVAEVKQYKKERIAAIDMETSALFAIAQYRHVEIGVLLIISDSLADLRWNPQFHNEKIEAKFERLFKILVDVLLVD